MKSYIRVHIHFMLEVKANSNVLKPLLTSLARTAMILPHGNAEVERAFSQVSDIVTKKRSSLKTHTLSALVVSKSILQAKKWTTANLAMDSKLTDLALNAKASCEKRRKEREQVEVQKKKEEREKALQDEIRLMTEQSKKLNVIACNAKETDEELERKRKERDERRDLLIQLQKQCEASDRQIEKLQEERLKLQKKKEKHTVKVVERVLKRQAITDIDLKDIKIPKK